MAKLSISILSANFVNLGEDINMVREGGADYLHIDTMDGVFVPQISYGQGISRQLSDEVGLPLDVHIMAVEPERQIDAFVTDNTEFIVVHYEAERHLDRTLKYIRSLGIKSGVAINPATSPLVIEYALSCADQVLVMSVNPGFGGQEFIPGSLEKIKCLKQMRKQGGYGFEIAVDGGVNEENIPSLIDAGTDILVVGSTIFSSENSVATMSRVRKLADSE